MVLFTYFSGNGYSKSENATILGLQRRVVRLEILKLESSHFYGITI
jgi:hypothetical protein